jgi:hypothetical protein
VLKNRGHFPSDETATKLIYLALRCIAKKWKNPPITWKLAATQFAIQFGERFFAADVPLKTMRKVESCCQRLEQRNAWLRTAMAWAQSKPCRVPHTDSDRPAFGDDSESELVSLPVQELAHQRTEGLATPQITIQCIA